MDRIDSDSVMIRRLRVLVKKTKEAVKETIDILMGKQQGQICDVPIRDLSHSLRYLRSILHDFYCRNTAAPRQAVATAGGALLDIKDLLHEINEFFEVSPSTVPDIIKCQDQLYAFHRRILRKILVFENASLNGELAATQSLLLNVGILSPQMPSLPSGSDDDDEHQLMSERTVPDASKDGSSALRFMSFPVEEGLFVGYFTYKHEPIRVGGAGLTGLILRFDLKMKIVQEEDGSGFTGHFRVELGQFRNELQTASVRNYSFVKTFKAGHFPWGEPEIGIRRLYVQKWQFGGEWKDRNFDMDCAECLGNFLHDEVDRDAVDSLDGEWYGFYFMGREQRPSDLPFHLTMRTSRSSEGLIIVTGEGKDEHGMFDIRGRFVEDGLLKKLEFRKIYFFFDSANRRVDRFGWDYKGTLEVGARGVSGTWGVRSRPQGTFSMTRVD